MLFAILNMGLGHATRTLPLIQYFLKQGWDITVGSSGRALSFLRIELPKVVCLELPDYGLRYTRFGVGVMNIISQIPGILRKVLNENIVIRSLVNKHHFDLIISDHRYGCFHNTIPSFFISHQLCFIAPSYLAPLEIFGKIFNNHFHAKFKRVFVPDYYSNGKGLLSGRLSEVNKKYFYSFPGILSSIKKKNKRREDIDLFISISGPEPQRTIFEQKIRNQMFSIPGKIVITLGKPESTAVEKYENNLTVYSHLNRKNMTDLMNSSKLIVCRSGYSTIMELAEIQKKAILVPTPGQTEQIYLAKRFEEKNWLFHTEQDQLNLNKQVHLSTEYAGFSSVFSTELTVKQIFTEIVEYI